MAATSYRTIARNAEAQIEVKRSRFLCTIERVGDEAAARAVVERLRQQHWDARHHCSAFVLGPDAQVQRSSDDGEPSGTAGAPMLEVLNGQQLSDVVAVVTRWFGGTLLGAGGLVRAYGDAVRAGLAEAGTLHRQLLTEFEVVVGHDIAGRFESDLRSRGFEVLSVSHAQQVSYLIGAAPDQHSALASAVGELSAGTATPDEVGHRWVDLWRPDRTH